MRIIVAAVISVVLAVSNVVPAHASDTEPATPMRGINLAGAEFTSAGLPLFDTPESFGYLASRGYTVVRLPFLWESVQPVLSAPLDAKAMTPLKKAVADASAAGLSVILDVHNYGIYRGTPYGADGSFTEADFTDLWTRLATEFHGSVAGYGLMNEPRNLPADDGQTGNQRWQQAQQAALDAIRATGDTTCVLVSGYTAGTMGAWLNPTTGQPVPYITDPADNFRWEAHHYWDATSTGKYTGTYADAVAAGYGSSQGDAARTRVWFELNQWIEWLKKYDQKGYIGEFGWPSVENGATESDAAAWNSLAELYFDRIGAESSDLVWTTAWATGSRWSRGYRLQFYSSTNGSLTSKLSNAAVLEAANPATDDVPTPPVVTEPTPPVVTEPTPPVVPEPDVPSPPVVTLPKVVTTVVTAVPEVTPVTRAASRITVTVRKGSVKKHAKPVLTVKVSSRVRVTGTVTVTYRGKTLGKAKIVRGKARIVLKGKLAKGVRSVKVRYAGTTTVAASVKKGVRVRVK